MTWYRHVSQSLDGSFVGDALPTDLDLHLYLWDGRDAVLLFSSDSLIDNVEHIFFRRSFDTRGRDYLLQVFNASQVAGNSEIYGVSWEYDVIPEPSLLWALALLAPAAALNRSRNSPDRQGRWCDWT